MHRPVRLRQSDFPNRAFVGSAGGAETVRSKARRTFHLGESRLVGFALGGEPDSRLSRKLAMPVTGATRRHAPEYHATPVLFNGMLQVPMMPWEHLIAFTALYCGLYMGGHTVKAIFGEQLAKR
jgi:hypothetical protein